jgi:predicted lipid-binding transport protein (Tim44 family)
VETTDEAAGLVQGATSKQADPSISGAHSVPSPELGAAEAQSNALQAAIDSHPSAEMQGELAALRAASLALVGANEREDDEAIDRYKPVYLEYRQAWVERMWQFCSDHQRIGNLRKRQ